MVDNVRRVVDPQELADLLDARRANAVLLRVSVVGTPSAHAGVFVAQAVGARGDPLPDAGGAAPPYVLHYPPSAAPPLVGQTLRLSRDAAGPHLIA